ncbi:glycoside hydrolase family 25 protein [Paenibacillus sinopodophylli]|uniref:glycoside hydrolase family 25 protein n=1 Tax=Paenibacillus sinopodophylli TaxID=1837342 RepID=UPI00110D0029|nr:GH25 family lysozyme [Paenibacillus sinopodophylli]
MRVKKTISILLGALLILCILEYKGIIWHNSLFAMKYEVKGLDVSHYQGNIDWATVAGKKKFQFAYMKATEGHDYTDDTFARNWEQAKANGLLVGAYHFFSSRSTGAEQAERFISVVPVDKNSMPPVIDLEIALNHDPLVIEKELKSMSDKLEAVYHKKPILYVTYDTYNTYTSSGFEDYDIWIRDIVKSPSLKEKRDWLLWQYGNRGHVDGIDAYVDLNVFNGTQDDFDLTFR